MSETEDYLREERRRVVGLVMSVSSLGLLPFVINNFQQGRWLVGLCAVAVIMVTLSNGIAGALDTKPLIDIVYLTPCAVVFLIVCFVRQGIIGVFWCYPAIVCHHFILPPRQARRAEVAFLVVGLVCAYFCVDFSLFTRFAVTLVLVSAACHLFIGIIAKQHSKIRGLSDELTQDNERLAELEEYRREFLADLSHGLGTPLTSIHMGIQALTENSVEPADTPEHLSKLLRQIEWVGQASKRLVNLSRWESVEPELFLEPTPLSQPLFAAVEALEDRLMESDIEFAVGSLRGVQVLADRDALREVFVALVENCVQHSGGGCLLSVQAETGEGHVIVTVADNGKGMDASEANKAKQRYYTSGGTGLGLAIVSHLLQAHGTDPQVQTDKDKGFSVSFRLAKPTRTSATSMKFVPT